MQIEPLHTRIERSLATGDVRLLYGLGVPFFVGTLAIIAALVTQSMWLVPVVLVALLAMAAIVVVGFSKMLDEEDDDQG